MNYIHFVNRTNERIVVEFEDSMMEIGVTGKDIDNGILSIADNGFYEDNIDIFEDMYEADAIAMITDEEVELIEKAVKEAKAPRSIKVPAAGKPKLVTKSSAKNHETQGNKDKNMEHYMKQLESLDMPEDVDVSKLRTG